MVSQTSAEQHREGGSVHVDGSHPTSHRRAQGTKIQQLHLS